MTNQQLCYYLQNLNEIDASDPALAQLENEGLIQGLNKHLVDGLNKRVFRKYILTNKGKVVLGQLQLDSAAE